MMYKNSKLRKEEMFYEKKIEAGNGAVIYLGQISRIFTEITSGSLPEQYHVMKPVSFSPDHLNRFFSEMEIGKINGFRTLKKQAEWMAGRYLVKNAVSVGHNYTEMNKIEIRYMEEGAPCLPMFPNTVISLSHSGKYTALIICISPLSTRKVAIDIEEIVAKNIDSIVKVAFTSSEIRQLDEISSGDSDNLGRLNRFYEIWTGKEAYLKYIGRGFHEPLKNIEINGSHVFHCGKQSEMELVSVIHDNHYITCIS